MAQDGPFATGENCGDPVRSHVEASVADRVHASVEQMEAARPQPALDRAARDAGLQELVPGEDAVLAGSQVRQEAFALGEALPPLLSQT
jgi:hypothetical protein